MDQIAFTGPFESVGEVGPEANHFDDRLLSSYQSDSTTIGGVAKSSFAATGGIPTRARICLTLCRSSIDSYLAVCSIQRPSPDTLAERNKASLSGLEARFRHAVIEARAGPAS